MCVLGYFNVSVILQGIRRQNGPKTRKQQGPDRNGCGRRVGWRGGGEGLEGAYGCFSIDVWSKKRRLKAAETDTAIRAVILSKSVSLTP